MIDDYRNTKYCPVLSQLSEKKMHIKQAILNAKPRAQDMHKYISNNGEIYKAQFVEAYNHKCAYCGVNQNIVGWKQFEIDHFRPQSSHRFKSKAQAGSIENLVLSCFDCNRAKSSLDLEDEDFAKVNPDDSNIQKVFVRDDEYYIRISDKFSHDDAVKVFYTSVGLDKQIHRLDYLLMNMYGLRDQHDDDKNTYFLLTKAIELLKQKRK